MPCSVSLPLQRGIYKWFRLYMSQPVARMIATSSMDCRENAHASPLQWGWSQTTPRTCHGCCEHAWAPLTPCSIRYSVEVTKIDLPGAYSSVWLPPTLVCPGDYCYHYVVRCSSYINSVLGALSTSILFYKCMSHKLCNALVIPSFALSTIIHWSQSLSLIHWHMHMWTSYHCTYVHHCCTGVWTAVFCTIIFSLMRTQDWVKRLNYDWQSTSVLK